MSDEKIETLASKFKKFFLMEEKQEVKLETATLEDGTTIEAEAFEVGNAVMIVTGDEKIPAPAGEITLEDGSILVINEEGLIAEVKPAASEDVEEEELSISELGNAILKINERLQAIEQKETLSKEELEAANEANKALVDSAKNEIESLKDKITKLSAQPATKPNSPAPNEPKKESTMVMLNSSSSPRDNVDNYYSNLVNSK